MTLITLVRHGETIWHGEDRRVGSSDIPMTPHGRSEAASLARWAATAELTSIRSSDLSRARVTAEECSTVTGLRLTIDPRLRELNLGQAEGLTRAQARASFPREYKAYNSDPVADHFPGGEHPIIAAERFTAGLQEAAATDPGGHVLVVAHSTVIRLALCVLLGIPLSRYRRAFPSLGNCTLTTIRHKPDRTGLLNFNCPLTAP